MIYIILPLVAGLITQVSKFFIKANRSRFTLRNIVAYSGMPSGHSAITASLATIIGLKDGLTTPAFAVALIMAFLTIRDAVGLRRYVGKQGEIINDLVENLDEDQLLDEKYPHLAERIGHTQKQALVGIIIGIIVSWLGYYLF